MQMGRRATGRTEALIKAAESTPGSVLVVSSQEHKTLILSRSTLKKEQIVTFQDLDKLRGRHPTVIIDHHAWEVAANELLTENENIGEQLKRIEKELLKK